MSGRDRLRLVMCLRVLTVHQLDGYGLAVQERDCRRWNRGSSDGGQPPQKNSTRTLNSRYSGCRRTCACTRRLRVQQMMALICTPRLVLTVAEWLVWLST